MKILKLNDLSVDIALLQMRLGLTPTFLLRMQRTIQIILLLILASASLPGCTEQRPAQKNVEDRGIKPSSHMTSEHGNKIELLLFDKKAFNSQTQHRGQIVGGARWRDLNGENLLLLTQTGKIPGRDKCIVNEPCPQDAEVYAYHYIVQAENVTLLWKLTDFQRDCSFDLYAGFILESVTITDLDSDGVAESTFLYKLSCRSDVSPARLKLIMHEGKNKFAIRGTSKLPGDYGGGDMNADPALMMNAGDPFGRFASEQWKKFVSEDKFEQF